jgi:hypothetical protein
MWLCGYTTSTGIYIRFQNDPDQRQLFGESGIQLYSALFSFLPYLGIEPTILLSISNDIRVARVPLSRDELPNIEKVPFRTSYGKPYETVQQTDILRPTDIAFVHGDDCDDAVFICQSKLSQSFGKTTVLISNFTNHRQ